jgi:hypothetical protein
LADDMMKVFSFDRGIERVLQGGDPERTLLPSQRTSVQPSEKHPDVRLHQLFDAPSMDSRLLDGLKPDLHDKSILVPARYHAMLGKVHRWIREASEDGRGEEGRRILEEAAALLEEEKGLMDLLDIYRYILHQA